MNIEEARKVTWLKSNPRPMGELLDEGYLTRDRLEWAAKWAYSSRQKEAARVLLDHISQSSMPVAGAETGHSGIELGMSLDQARATLWPMPPYKGQPMGMLVESRQLTLKDLGYGVENAWDEKVRKAAMALSLARMNQIIKEPAPSAGFVHILSGGRSFSERQQTRYTIFEGMIFGAVISILIFYWGILISRFPSNTQTSIAKQISEILAKPATILALAIALVGVIFIVCLLMFLLDKVISRLEKVIEEHRRGEDGEDRAIQMIVQALDGNWSVFRNLRLPGRNKGDLDIVLVGPPGVWALEVKNLNGEYRNIGDTWEYQRGNNWKKSSANPSQQAVSNAARLGNFFKVDNIKTFVNSAVVWANAERPPQVENPSTAVWLYTRIPEELGNIWQGEKLTRDERQKIIQKLTKLCEAQQRKSDKLIREESPRSS